MAEYIDAEPLKKEIADFKRTVKCDNSDYLTGYICALSAVEGMIAEQPAADVELVVHAKWIPWGRDTANTRFIHCSRCNFEVSIYEDSEDPDYLYCPNCGAKMGGEENA